MMRESLIIPNGLGTQVTPADGEFIVYGHSKPRVPKYRHSLGATSVPRQLRPLATHAANDIYQSLYRDDLFAWLATGLQ